MGKKYKPDPMIHIGHDQDLKKSTIIGIFSEDSLKPGSFLSDEYEKIEIVSDKRARSIIYCTGHFLVPSTVKAKTLQTRYEKVRKTFSKKQFE